MNCGEIINECISHGSVEMMHIEALFRHKAK